MFGLMRAKTCGLSEEQKQRRRLHYCGTCKTIGSLYGQKSRMLLNHDTVFLAEILTALQEENAGNWQKAYQSYNCLSLPENEMPVALQFAATTNLALAHFKLADHFEDTGKKRWRIADKTFRRDFQKALAKLSEFNFPLDELKAVLSEQKRRENSFADKSAEEILKHLAQPTARATAMFFAEGVKLIGKRELKEKAAALGASFGELVYLLDAFEDFEKDFREQQFNAFRAAFDYSEKKLAGDARRKAVEKIRVLENEIVEKLETLPLSSEDKQLFAARLQTNLQRKLKTELPVLATRKKHVCATKKTTFAERWQTARTTARELTAKSFQGFSWKNSWQVPFAFAAVAFVAFVSPAQAAKAKSTRECAELGLNLMFLGSLVGAVVASTVKMAMPPGNVAEKLEKKRRWCDWCDCDCCDCCDGVECCCDCGDCCGNCDGCDGCCDCNCDC